MEQIDSNMSHRQGKQYGEGAGERVGGREE